MDQLKADQFYLHSKELHGRRQWFEFKKMCTDTSKDKATFRTQAFCWTVATEKLAKEWLL